MLAILVLYLLPNLIGIMFIRLYSGDRFPIWVYILSVFILLPGLCILYLEGYWPGLLDKILDRTEKVLTVEV